MTRKFSFKANTKHFLLLIVVIQLVWPQNASSQCIDSLTVAESNFYLIKGAQAREQLSLCQQYRQLDSATIAQHTKINSKLLDAINERDKRINTLQRNLTIVAVLCVIFAVL